MSPQTEFSHVVRAHEIGGTPRRLELDSDAAQRTAVAARFGLLALNTLAATVELRREAAGIRLTGTVTGSGDQACVASGDPVPFRLREPIALLLTDATPDGGEIELSSDDLDVEPLDGDAIDVGEIAVQTLALGLDPYPRRPGSVAGILSEEDAIAERSPFAVLKGR